MGKNLENAAKNLQLLGNEEFQRENKLKDLATETAAEYEVVGNLVESLRGVLHEIEIAQEIGSMPPRSANERSLAIATTSLIKVLFQIGKADFRSGYISRLQKQAKTSVHDLSKMRDEWPELVQKKDALYIKKKLSSIMGDLIKALRKMHKQLGHDTKELNADLKKTNNFFTFR